MKVLKECARAELVVKNSRFIAELFIVTSQSQAREKLHELKQKYFDARHVVHAFVIGKNAEVSGMSDDGEPSGTAGRPVFDVLKGSGITNVLLTVTRYFGGTLLGTGGLVHAYSDSAKAVLDLCKTEELVERSYFSFTADYSIYESIKRFFSQYNIDCVKEEYSSEVFVSGRIYTCQSESFKLKIFDISKGRLEVQFLPCT